MATIQETSDAVRVLIDQLATGLSVDPEGFLISRLFDDQRITLGKAEQSQEVLPAVIYQEKYPEGCYYIINPFAEGLGPSTIPQTYFYKSLRLGLNFRIFSCLTQTVKVMEDQKKPEAERDPSLTEIALRSSIMSLLSAKTPEGKSVIDEIDGKTVDELKQIFNGRMDEFAEIIYKQRQMSSTLVIPFLENPDFTNSLKVRKKTIHAVQGILKAMLQIPADSTDLSKFTHKSVPNSSSKLSSWLGVLLSVYACFNQALEDFSDSAVNLGLVQNVYDRIGEFTSNARWQTSSKTTGVTSSQHKGLTSQDIARQGQVPGVPTTNTTLPGATSTMPVNGGMMTSGQPVATTPNVGSTMPPNGPMHQGIPGVANGPNVGSQPSTMPPNNGFGGPLGPNVGSGVVPGTSNMPMNGGMMPMQQQYGMGMPQQGMMMGQPVFQPMQPGMMMPMQQQQPMMPYINPGMPQQNMWVNGQQPNWGFMNGTPGNGFFTR